MVDPISQSDRTRTFRWVKLGLVVLVGLSAGLIAVQGDADLGVVVASVASGSVLGIGLVWYLFPDLDALAPASGQRYRR